MSEQDALNYFKKGEDLKKIGKINDALECYNKALKIFQENKLEMESALCLNRIGLLLHDKGDLEQALNYYERALEICEKLGNLEGKAAILNNIGELLKDRDELDQALNYYRQALEIYEKLNDLKGKATSLNRIGVLLHDKGDLGQAIDYFKQALTINEKLGNLEGKATILNNIGQILGDRGDLDQALNCFKQTLEINEKLGNLTGKVRSLNNIGQILHDRGELDQALNNYKQALEIDEKLGTLEGKATSLNNIGVVLHDRGELDQALNNYKQALEIYEKLGNLEGKAAVLNNIGQILRDKGEILHAPSSDIPRPITDQVHFTVTAPSTVVPDNSYVLDVWAHLDEQRQEVIRRAKEAQGQEDIRAESKGPVRIARGSVLTVHLSIPDFVVKDSEDTILWEGNIGNARFPFTVPSDASAGGHLGVVNFYVDGIMITKLHFTLEVALQEQETPIGILETQEKRICSAFASYASADRDEVLARIHGMLKVLPNLDLFLDVASLRSGEHFEKRLMEEIEKRDIFYLFWSRAASNSKWVEKEWRTALDKRGIEYVNPVPLVSPHEVPPPKELAELHFNDWVLAYMRGKG